VVLNAFGVGRTHGQEELEALRKQANEIDSFESPYKAIVSVLMLKEGWDVRNVTTIVGLRAYAAKSNILPEQTLGRGLRKMYPGLIEEWSASSARMGSWILSNRSKPRASSWNASRWGKGPSRKRRSQLVEAFRKHKDG
jgi:superfamily II DNA or RNA helicase